jgi:hypothetical protein
MGFCSNRKLSKLVSGKNGFCIFMLARYLKSIEFLSCTVAKRKLHQLEFELNSTFQGHRAERL